MNLFLWFRFFLKSSEEALKGFKLTSDVTRDVGCGGWFRKQDGRVRGSQILD